MYSRIPTSKNQNLGVPKLTLKKFFSNHVANVTVPKLTAESDDESRDETKSSRLLPSVLKRRRYVNRNPNHSDEEIAKDHVHQ